MEKYIKYLCLNLILLIIASIPVVGAEADLRLKGDYFLYSDDHDYLYGGGNISLKSGDYTIRADTVYMNIELQTGLLYGNVQAIKSTKSDKSGSETFSCDALFFKGIPPRFLRVSYGDEIAVTGDNDLLTLYSLFDKKSPDMLKTSSLYFEFKECTVDKNKKIRAKIVIPYMMGLPTVPLSKFTIKRGEWAEKTMLAFNSINYSGIDGLSLGFLLRLREKAAAGDYDIKLYERGLFKMEDPKRGVLFSGQGKFKTEKKELLNYTLLYNSGKQSYNLKLVHRNNLKLFGYAFSQLFSGQENRSLFSEFSAEVSINRLKYIVPKFQVTHDWKGSVSYQVSTPVNILKNLNLQLNWQRRILESTYHSDTADFGASFNFLSSFFSLASNYNFSKNLLESAIRKNFSVNLRMKPILLLMDNVTLDVSSFYMFSSLPLGNSNMTRISPGVDISLRSAGVEIPLGFKIVPGFRLNHLWDNREDNYTDFNYLVSLQREIGYFRASVDYTTASRYLATDFWIEGNNRKNINLSFEYKKPDYYSFLMRYYWNNNMVLENSSFTGLVQLPYDLKFSSFLLYYNREKRFQTVEVFIEKTFKKKLKIQGGYSLALKRFFIKFLNF